MEIHSSRKGNKSLRIDTIGNLIPDDRSVNDGTYDIAFSMIGGGKKYWEYSSKEERDDEFERVKKEIDAAR